MDDRELAERLDACRSAAELHDVELAGLAERLDTDPHARASWDAVRRADRAIERAFPDVDVPAGLQARLLAGLTVAAAIAPTADVGGRQKEETTAGGLARRCSPCAVPQSAATEVPSPAPAEQTTKSHRRFRWLAAASVAAAVVAVAVPLAIVLRGPRITAENVAARVAEYNLTATLEATAADDSLPPSASVRRETIGEDRAAPGFLGTQAVAYPLRRGQARATHYVAPLVVAGLPKKPPGASSVSGSSPTVVAWQEGDLLYALVVDGGPRDYPLFIRPRSPTVALAGR
jgi:hypothetical protein